MARKKTQFVCDNCGYKTSKWLGRCPECQTWDSLVEEVQTAKIKSAETPLLLNLAAVTYEEVRRIKTGLGELDRVLGGGLAPGSVTLLSGEPGVGKSTLLLQAAAGVAAGGKRLLYVTGEESAAQVRLRAERLGLNLEELWICPESNLTPILQLLAEQPWDILAVDSIQTMYSDELASPPGSPGQIRECSARLTQLAKNLGRPVWLVGHITKEGAIAGPKLLEHLVDTVLYFEGDQDRSLRLLRSFKNRFGSVNEIGVFEMTAKGLGEVANPSALFLAERPKGASGSVVTAVMEGQRPLLMEVQSLVSESPLAQPRRQSLGVDSARVSLLAAVLEKKVRLKLFDRDIFINVAGGAKISEPAADLAIVAAMASSWIDKAAPGETVFIGEVGLAGEVRGVSKLESRLRESLKMGFTSAIVPYSEEGLPKISGLVCHPVKNVAALLLNHLNFTKT